MAPNLASCDVFGIFLKYGLSTEGGFGGGEKPILVGVLVISGIGLLPSVCEWLQHDRLLGGICAV